MEFIKVSINVSSKGIDDIVGMLLNLDIIGVIIDDPFEMSEFIKDNPMNWDYVDEELEKTMNSDKEPSITFYIENNSDGIELLNSVKTSIEEFKKNLENSNANANENIQEFGSLNIIVENTSDSEWKDKWKETYKPFVVGENILIRPSWEDVPKEFADNKNTVVLTINPGQVFGTGLHQSTKLCITHLEKYLKNSSENIKVIDVGCGSGILAITSLLLGANFAYGIDMEIDSEKVFCENAELNNIDKTKYKIGIGNVLLDENLRNSITDKFNIAVVNIVADVVIALSPFIKSVLTQNGVFISSGIIEERENDVLTALTDNGFKIISKIKMDNWVSFMCEV